MFWSRPAFRAAALAAAATVGVLVATVGVLVSTATGAPVSSATAAATPKCTASGTQVWLGLGLGGGTAGSTYYPLEFSNVGRHACTLTGYPGVSAYGAKTNQLGPAASRTGQRTATVRLAPGATAHAILRLVDWGALCSKEVVAQGIKVYPPGETRPEPIPFSFGACAHRGVLVVGPVRAGVGVPGYTTS